MDVSVIVPVYNGERDLARCLDSLVGQSLEGMEIIVVDDGSTDGTPEVIRRYVERHPGRVRALRKENGGQGAARNLGLAEASGEYVGFVDADDYVSRDMFGRMLAAAREADADLVTCDYTYTYGGERDAKRVTLAKPARPLDLFFDPWAAPWNKLYRRSMLVDNGIAFPGTRAYEDTAFYADLIPFVRRIANVDEAFVHQYFRESSTMNQRQDERVLLIFDVVDDIIAFYRAHGVYERYREYLEYFCVKILFSSSVLRICQIRDRAVRRDYLDRSIGKALRLFPGYRRNRFFRKGLKGLYVRSVNRLTLPLYADLIYLIRYRGRKRL
ncbi:glycosyl transferase family 2 [Bifidobacterium rousetti]|uniref:glycosyltransferase n=1 Tax=Bifidobacterium rousetti TaxID=2045439 RepID=UPI00123BA893|nr:glycosyltransferase [Bifidobacterium rousetti]KAA8816913.1 glycosyl transferase family 2 [Bifidobacterium rousetti]